LDQPIYEGYMKKISHIMVETKRGGFSEMLKRLHAVIMEELFNLIDKI
jgi:hypothetical protein